MDNAIKSSVWVASPEFSGWLFKRGFHWRKLWKKRWVALHGTELAYMDKEPNLHNYADIVITKSQLSTGTIIDKDGLGNDPNGFIVHVNDGHLPQWNLRAESAREKKNWLSRLDNLLTIIKWLDDFEKVRVLGVGGTGVVYEIRHKDTKRELAMKEMEIKNKVQMSLATHEAEMLKEIVENISHPNIMQIEKVVQIGSRFYLIFPLCKGGELYEHVVKRGHFTELDAAKIIRDLASALAVLHQHDIMHLDIKPENILMQSDDDHSNIFLTDFGLSRKYRVPQYDEKPEPTLKDMYSKRQEMIELGTLHKEKLRGTIGYMSPELILCGFSCKATDVFSVGVVLFILLSGRPPFHSKSQREVLEKSAKCEYTMSGNEWKQISDDAKDLVRRMLVFDPAERITCEDILAHKWLELDDSVTGELTSTSDSSTLPKTDTVNKHAISSSSSSSSQNLVGSHSSPVQGRPSIHLSQALHLLSSHVGERRVARLATRLSRLISTLASANHSKSSLAQFIRPNIKVDPADPQTQQLFSMKQRRLNRALNYQPEELLGIQHATHFMKILTKVFDECGPVKGKLSLSMFGYLWTHFITNLHTSDTENLTDDVYADEEKKNGDNIQSEGESTTNAAQTSTKTEGLSDITELTMKNSTILQTPTHKPQRHSDNKLAPTPVITYSLDDPSVHTNTDSPTQQAESSGALKYPLVLMCKFMDRDRDGLISLDDLFTVQALSIQDSDAFHKLLFRVYVEAAWYPGRQLNYLNALQNLDTPPTGKASTGTTVSECYDENVVDPPKHITSRNIMNMFEKLGLDPEGGRQIFTALCEVLRRRKAKLAFSGIQEEDEEGDDDDDDDDDEEHDSLRSSVDIDNIRTRSKSTASQHHHPSSNPHTEADIRTLSGVVPTMPTMPTVPTVNVTPTHSHDHGSNHSADRMDISDFLSAIQIDRILVQVLLIHIHSSLFQLIDLSVQETASSDQSESGGEASPFLMSLEEQINESIAKYKDMQTAHQSRSYSIVKAVGQVALSAAIGVVKTIGFGASAIIEARREALDHNTKLNYSTPTASRLSSPRTGAVAIRQDDDVEENEESGADLVSRLNLTSSANRHASK